MSVRPRADLARDQVSRSRQIARRLLSTARDGDRQAYRRPRLYVFAGSEATWKQISLGEQVEHHLKPLACAPGMVKSHELRTADLYPGILSGDAVEEIGCPLTRTCAWDVAAGHPDPSRLADLDEHDHVIVTSSTSDSSLAVFPEMVTAKAFAAAAIWSAVSRVVAMWASY